VIAALKGSNAARVWIWAVVKPAPAIVAEGKAIHRNRRHGCITSRTGNRQRPFAFRRLPPMQKERLRLMHGSLIYRDQRLAGFDAAAVVEVVEHLDRPDWPHLNECYLNVRGRQPSWSRRLIVNTT